MGKERWERPGTGHWSHHCHLSLMSVQVSAQVQGQSQTLMFHLLYDKYFRKFHTYLSSILCQKLTLADLFAI